MTAADPGPPRTAWRTSTHSGNGGDCVEVAATAPGTIAVRDSKNPHGPALAFPAGRWQAFTRGVKATSYS
jgi:Domain of unknown function (DUF397)